MNIEVTILFEGLVRDLSIIFFVLLYTKKNPKFLFYVPEIKNKPFLGNQTNHIQSKPLLKTFFKKLYALVEP